MASLTTKIYPKFGVHSKNILRVPKLRKNSRIKSRWGVRYHTAVHNAVFRKHCSPYMPTEPPAYLSEEVVESDPLYVCKHCKDCFRFQNSFEDHNKRRSWILALWCHDCFITVCTHMTTIGSECPTCKKKDNDKRAYLRLRGLTRTQKLGATKIFYNQCQLFEHMRMHGINLVDLGNMMLMPIPAGMSDSDWTPELELACEALMEHVFILRMHIMDWLKLYNLEDKWWKIINDKSDDNVISEIIKNYQGREIFQRIEKSTAHQFIDFDSPDTDISKSSADEFDDAGFVRKHINGNSDNIHDKSITENEDNPCMSNDIAFVDCGSTPQYFEPESMELESSVESEQLSAKPELSYVLYKKVSTDVKQSRDITSHYQANKMSNKRKILSHKNQSLLKTNLARENTIMVIDSNKKFVKPSKGNAKQHQTQSLLKKTVQNNIDESALNEVIDSPIKMEIAFTSKERVSTKFNLDHEQNVLNLTADDIKSKIDEFSSRFVSNKKPILGEQDSHDNSIVSSKSIENKSSKSLLCKNSTKDDILSQKTCNSTVKQITDKIMLDDNYLIKSKKYMKHSSENSSNISLLHNASNTSISMDSNEPIESKIVDTEQAALLHNSVSCLTVSPSSNEFTESLIKNSLIRSKVTSANTKKKKKKLFEIISLIEQENGDLYMNIKLDRNIKGLNRNVCDTMYKLRQEMITEFKHLSHFELKKRIDHLHQASEETRKVLNFVPNNILNEKLRAISTLQLILDTNYHHCSDSNEKDDDDIILDEWESDLSTKTNLCKCTMCYKPMKPKSYYVGFSKLSKNDDLYCTCYKHVCHECLTYQGNVVSFVAHQNLHKKKKPYICPDCRLKFNSDTSLEAHIWTVCFHTLKKRVFACKICEIDGFRDMESLTRHFVSMHSNTKVACKDCLKVFSSYSECKKHYVQMHSSVPEQDSMIRLVICRLSGIIMRYENYISYLENSLGIRKLTWFKCPLCPLIAVEYKNITSAFNAHLLNMHLHCLPVLISQEALNLIFGTKYADLFAKIPKIVNTETISTETFECGSQNMYDTCSIKFDKCDIVNSETAEKAEKEKAELLPKILNVQSMSDPKQSESEKIIGTNKESNFQMEVTTTENINLLCEHPKEIERIEVDNNKLLIKEEKPANDKSINESGNSYIPKSDESPSIETSDINLSHESNKSVSNSDLIRVENTDRRIKVVDIKKICKPNVEPFIAAELCETQIKVENENVENENCLVESVPKPPPLARIPYYMFESTKAENPDGSSNIARSACKNNKTKTYIAMCQSMGIDINYSCHLCGERINTSVVRTHFREKHSDKCRLMIVTPQLQRISSEFINGGYKRHLNNRKRKSDNALCVSKKKRRWTPKKYVDLSAPVGLCVEQETAEDSDGNFKCKRCGQCCTNISDLREHIASSHRLKGRFLICLECGENFVVAPSLQMHLKAFHGIEDPITYMSQNPSYAPDTDALETEGKTTVANQCHVCMAVFEDKAAVDKHLRVHGMAFLNRKRIEARNAQKIPEKNVNIEENKQNIITNNPKEIVKRDKPAEAILEKLNAVI